MDTVWDEIIYQFPNFKGYTVEVWERISYFIPHLLMDVLIHAGFKVDVDSFAAMRVFWTLKI